MNCPACIAQLDDYIDDALSPVERSACDAHLSSCPGCRAQLDALARLRVATRALPREITPTRNLWSEIQPQLDLAVATCAAESMTPIRGKKRPSAPLPFLRFLAPFGVAAAVALLCTFVARHQPLAITSGGSSWSVATLEGAPQVAAIPIRGSAPFRVGQWLETDARSTAKIAVGDIGEVRVSPDSRLRLTGASPTEHRLQLARGTVDALIWAPPRLFFVDTPSATAVDLGCAYTLTVDAEGNSELHVTAGYVALEDRQHESVVPYGLKCRTRRGIGPGTPFSTDAPATLLTALEQFDFGPPAGRASALDTVLQHARVDDAVTVWHLLSRSSGAARGHVFDTLARLSPPPDGVTRAQILAGDKTARRAWGTALGLGDFGR